MCLSYRASIDSTRANNVTVKCVPTNCSPETQNHTQTGAPGPHGSLLPVEMTNRETQYILIRLKSKSELELDCICVAIIT